MTSVISIHITAANEAEAKRLAHALVDARLAACVTLFPATSVYRWENKMVEGAEVVLIAKTRTELFDAVREKVKSLHSYAVPCIVAIPVVAGDADYLKWVETETGKAP